MSLESTPTEVLARRLKARAHELREYERACLEAGGWPTSDPRVLRMTALGKEVDELDAVLMEREYLEAHEDDDDLDEHG